MRLSELSPIESFLRILPKPGRFGRLLAASIALSLLVMWSLYAGIAFETYRDEWDESSAFYGDVASLLEQDIARNVELYDLSLRATSRNINDVAIRNLPLEVQRKVLFDPSANASGFGSILVLDRSGDVVMDSKALAKTDINLSDRDYFIAQRDGVDQSQPFVSRPFKSRISQVFAIAFSRRRTAPDGSFDGIVVGTMTLDYFARLFHAIHLPPGSAITLVHRDGTVLMREPEVTGEVGRSLGSGELVRQIKQRSSGFFVKRSLLDDVERLFVFKQVGALPIYMTVGLSTSEFLQHWRWRVELIGLGFLVLSAIIFCLGFMLALELDRRTQAERTLANLASTDGLTLLANRRRFNEVLDIEWRRAARERTTISLVMIDGDFFKAFNDTYGHVEGDEALRAIAETLRTCVSRPGDLVARFGGEEFVALLPRTDSAGADRIARSIRQAVVAIARPHRGSPMGFLTVSLGVASQQPASTDPASALIEAADSALYTAKSQGRDRIVIATVSGNRHIAQTESKVA